MIKDLIYKIIDKLFGHSYFIYKPIMLPKRFGSNQSVLYNKAGNHGIMFGYSRDIYKKCKNNRLKICKWCREWRIDLNETN